MSGAALAPAARVEQVARLVDLLRDEVDVANLKRLLRKQAGAALDPDVVAAFCNDADELATVGDGSFEQLLAAERHPHQLVDAAGIDEATAVFGAVADMKSPYLTGHSRGVSHLASEAARCGGLPDADVVALRRAGLVHDIGRVAVSSVVWNKKGPLSGAEWELVSLHPHHTGRILARTPELAGITALAAAHHERIDGSGYPRSLSGPQLSPAASLLAAADVATGLAENRPHRPAVPPAQRVQTLRAEARAGRLTVPAVEAVLTALHEPTARLPRPDDRLTAREVEVPLVASGATNRAVGSALGISPKTVNTHLEHIHRKLGVSSRAAAVFYAVQAGHVDGSGFDAS